VTACPLKLSRARRLRPNIGAGSSHQWRADNPLHTKDKNTAASPVSRGGAGKPGGLAAGAILFLVRGRKSKIGGGRLAAIAPQIVYDRGITNGHAHRFSRFAVELLLKGVSLEDVATLLGNTIRVAEKHYSPWVQKRQDALEAAVKGTW
jgi:hypothetical protein